MRRIIMLAAVTRTNRHAVMSIIDEAVAALGGWISGHQLYGNMVTVFRFELQAGRLAALAERLEAEGIRLDPRSHGAIAEIAPSPEDRACALNVTFIHDEPDVKRDVPAVPG